MIFLVVAAWEPELARFRALAGGEAGIVMETLGVGVVEASIAMTRCIARQRPAAALLLGTCGAFELPVGRVVAGASVRLVEGGIIDGASAMPAPMPSVAPFDRALHDVLVHAGAKSVQIANTVGVTTDDALASRLAVAGDVEHLEAFAFARACASAEEGAVPCAAVLGIANAVGSRGRDEWLANHEVASAAAAAVAWQAFAAMRAITKR